MTTVNLSAFAGAGAQFFDNNGVPLSGGLLYTYGAGTTTPQATYTSSSGSIANANPIVLDSSGRVTNEIWLTPSLYYKFVLQTATATQIGSYDNIPGIANAADIASLESSSGATLIGYNEGGSSAVNRTVASKLQESVSVLDFGADPTGASDSTTAFQNAINSSKTVYVPTPSVAYLLSSGTITIPDGHKLIGTGRTNCKLNITANSGINTSANAAFVLTGTGSVSGFYINYPNQLPSDLVSSIVVYPPTFLVNGSYGGEVSNIFVNYAYNFLRQDATGFANLTLKDIYGNFVQTAFSFVGHMGDVSWAENVHVVYSGKGFGGPVDLWQRANVTAWSFVTSGSNRIDLIEMVNCGVVGGAIAFYGGGLVWLDMANWYSDITTQSFVGTFNRLDLVDGWVSCQDSYYNVPNMPAMSLTSSSITLSSFRISLQATGSSCAIYATGTGLFLSSGLFSTSQGYFTPCIYNGSGTTNISSCQIQTSVENRTITFTDINTYDGVGTTIDGIRQFSKITTPDLGPTNFNMATWGTTTAGVPDNWTTNLSTPSNFISQLSGGTAGIQIYPSTPQTASFYLQYSLNSSYKDLFGYFYVTAYVQIVDTNNSGVDGYFSWSIGNATDGFNISDNALGNAGTNSQCSSLPANQFIQIGSLLCVPPNPSGTLAIRLNCTYNTATSDQIKLQIKGLQLWVVNAFYNPQNENATGHEFLYAQKGNVRDFIIPYGIRQYYRTGTPSANYSLLNERIYNVVPTVGQPKSWVCTVAGSPGTWVSEGNL